MHFTSLLVTAESSDSEIESQVSSRRRSTYTSLRIVSFPPKSTSRDSISVSPQLIASYYSKLILDRNRSRRQINFRARRCRDVDYCS